MSYTLYDITYYTLNKALESLTGILKKAETQDAKNDYFQAKLFPDMLTLNFQVYKVCDMVNTAQAHMQGKQKEKLGEEIKSFEEAYARIRTVSELLEHIDKEVFSNYADKTVEAGALGVKLKGADFINDFLVPQTYFHLTTAYAILRKEGVPLGKRDYIGPWFGRHMG